MASNLKAELAQPQYAGMTDQQAADALNAPISLPRPADLSAVKLILYQDATPSAMLRIETAAATPDTTVEGLQIAARQANAYLNDVHMTSIDFTNPLVAAGIGLLVAGGVLSKPLVDQVEALGQSQTTRARQIGLLLPVTAAFVNRARIEL